MCVVCKAGATTSCFSSYTGSDSTFAPERFYTRANDEQCKANMRKVIENLNAMQSLLRNFSDTTEKTLLVHLKDEIGKHLRDFDKLCVCLEEYPNALARVLEFKTTTKAKINKDFQQDDELRDVTFDYVTEMMRLLRDEAELNTLLRQYSMGHIEKLKYLETFASSATGGTQQVLGSLETLVDKITQELLDPLLERLDDIESVLTAGYKDALLMAMEFEEYLKNDTYQALAAVILLCSSLNHCLLRYFIMHVVCAHASCWHN